MCGLIPADGGAWLLYSPSMGLPVEAGSRSTKASGRRREARKIARLDLDALVTLIPEAMSPRLWPLGDLCDSARLFEALFRPREWQLARGASFPVPRRLLDELRRAGATIESSRLRRDRSFVPSALLDWMVHSIDYDSDAPWRAAESATACPARAFQVRLSGRDVSRLTVFRFLMVMRWLMRRIRARAFQDSKIRSHRSVVSRPRTKSTDPRLDRDRVERVKNAVQKLATALGTSVAEARQTTLRELPHEREEPDLPDHMAEWPSSWQEFARVIRAMDPRDIDPEFQSDLFSLLAGPRTQAKDPRQAKNLSALGSSLEDEKERLEATVLWKGKVKVLRGDELKVSRKGKMKVSRKGKVKPATSPFYLGDAKEIDVVQGHDPFAREAYKALQRILTPEIKKGRVELICDLLNIAYPKGYIPPDLFPPGLPGPPPHAPTGLWKPEAVRRWRR